MFLSGKVQSSQEGKNKLNNAIKTVRQMQKDQQQEQLLTQTVLAKGAYTSEDTVKRLLGTKPCNDGVERRLVIAIVDCLNNLASTINKKPTVIIKTTDIVNPKEWNGKMIPSEFEAIVQDKTRIFIGRDVVFKEIQRFLESQPCGYFTVVGLPGMGKSAIAAKYVADNNAIPYFNNLAEGRNRPELFTKSVREQLIKRYDLQNAKDANLPDLLTQVSRKLSFTDRLVIVVDALDEVEQEPGGNILYLPQVLPDKIYFLLTRRPYLPNKRRLSVSPGVPVEELDLTKSYVDASHKDAKNCIRFYVDKDLSIGDALRRWIQNRMDLTREEFVERVAVKSENNFMYLGYVLRAIARGFYDDLTLNQLPDGLQDYYQQHWVRMGMDDETIKVIILFILVEAEMPITCKLITEITQEDEYEVQKVLDEWVEYLTRQILEREICYSFYHVSYLDFLKAKRELNRHRRLLKDVYQHMDNYFEREGM